MNKLDYKKFTEKGEKKIRLLSDFVHYSKELKRFVTVEKGFVSDGASVPKIFWRWFPPFGKYLEAAVVHDWLCVNKEIKSTVAALVFREAMILCKVKPWKIKIMYRAVRHFGPRF